MPDSADTKLPFLQVLPTGPTVPVALMGEMRYHARATHPDILPALSMIGKVSAKYQAEHFQLLKNTLLYVKGSDAPLIFFTGCLRTQREHSFIH
jgi:hypothetical protein